MTNRDWAHEHLPIQGQSLADHQAYTDGEDHPHDQLAEMASLQLRRQPCTPASTRSRHRPSVPPTPRPSGADQRLRLQHQALRAASQTQPTRASSPAPPPSSEQPPHAPSPPPLQRQSPPRAALPGTPHISREESPDVAPLPHGQQFCSCCRRRPDQTGQTDETDAQVEPEEPEEPEATVGTSTCAVHSTQSKGSSRGRQGSGSPHERHSSQSDNLSKMDRQRESSRPHQSMRHDVTNSRVRDAREYMERRRRYQ